ncbi:MAG: hypothetical protein RIC95_08365 [Vicingaceae bacterium]
MGFWRRFRLFLIGVGLGLILVMVFFGSRDWTSWTPESRVLTAIDSSEVRISERAECQLACLELNEERFTKLKAASSVNFKESNVKADPCPVYRLESSMEERDYQLFWEVCEGKEKVKLLSVVKIGQECNCE